MRARILTALVTSGLVGFLAGQPAAQQAPPAPVPVVIPAPVEPPAVPPPPQRKLELTFHGDGTVTLVAQNVQLREILTEWTRRGGSRIEGAERLPASPSQPMLKYVARPESEVLDSLLRSAAGVILMPRLAGSAGPSRLDVHVLATSAGTPMYAGQPSSPMQSSFPTPGSPGDEIPGVQQIPPPQPQPNANQQPASPAPAGPRPPGVVPIQVITPVTPVTPGTTTPPPPGRGGGGGR